jgi:predicted amidohydrolase
MLLALVVFSGAGMVSAQTRGKAKVAVIQATAEPNQDPFMDDYDFSKVRPGMEAHLDRLLALFEKAGRMGADIVCGPEDMQHIGSYGLYIGTKDPGNGKILFNSLAEKIPGQLTGRLGAIAKKYNMYVVAPIYEDDNGKIYNTAVVFGRDGSIIGKHRKTILPIMETWLVSTGDNYEVFQTDFGKIAVATCWELSYPEIPEIYTLEGADLIFHPTMAPDNKPGESLSTAPMFITRARDNSVYIAPVVLGTDGNGIIDFDGNVLAEAPGKTDAVIMTEIDFTRERIAESAWWTPINGTDNVKAMRLKSRRPSLYTTLINPVPPVMERYRDIRLTTGDVEQQLKAVKTVDYGPKEKTTVKNAVADLHLLPVPELVKENSSPFVFSGTLTIVSGKNASVADKFAADELISDLKTEFGINAVAGAQGQGPSIILSRNKTLKNLGEQGYTLSTRKNEIVIQAYGEAGLFYGTQTLMQLIEKTPQGYSVRGVEISDKPDIMQRAIHYDTKHHQDKASYVKSFIKDLSRFKVNMLVWEWEDKFAYPSHPEIGAPGAFTPDEMREFTKFARQYHIQIVPLVQGLGHVSFILKWPQFKDLREIPSSNWEFCPLKEGSYKLLFDLWKDAAAATPGSEYFHIGSDETYELGACEACKSKAEEIGRGGVYQLFINKSADYLRNAGRKVMAWEPPMGWEHGDSPARGIKPVKGLVFTESYEYETPGFTYAEQARDLGYEVFAYDPNPGVVPMMVPYYFELGEKGEPRPGSLERSRNFLMDAAGSDKFKGMISTSWDDDDLHNQMWMMHFVDAATYSWNHEGPSLDEFRNSFFRNYYGSSEKDLGELFRLLNEGAYFFAWSMERNVWHYGEIGQTHLPDLPRGDGLEYDPYWNTQYRDKVQQSEEMLEKMNRSVELIEKLKTTGPKHGYDLDLMRTTAELVRHTCLTYLDLSKLEYLIKEAHVNRFADCSLSLSKLIEAQHLLENTLKRRETVFNGLVSVYEETRLPKGYSTPGKAFFWQQDRARHFGFRRPDMSFLIYDEQLLDIEGYLEKLKAYIGFFKENSMN